jgi:hypothetical protein
VSRTLSVATPLKSPQTQTIEASPLAAFQRHYTPQELAELWGFDPATIRRMFIDEPGVLKEGKRGRRDGKRDYTSLRIPESIALMVHARKTR